MKALLKIASYIFHPVWMPFLGSLFYFLFIPRFFPDEVVKAKLMAIAIITVFIPIIFHFLLKNLNKVSSLFLDNVTERRWPLLFYILLCVMVLNQILNIYNYPGLFYYFLGILGSTVIAYIFSWFKLKVSLHMVGLAGLVMFVAGFCIYYHLYFIYTLSFMIIAMGLTASSRLYFKAHSSFELIMGILVGLIPQILALKFWL
ncbi:hypothetical protein C7S20_08010 [Christiangramia fulva]|uniref:PAP2 family protein n=1 Tax=Christiangramia fulva TaxID=2126553 RepID=A0A2R3Z4R0_9FLAO|nr:hypothetical protein [Christiangramia fulva]AVR45218.1 hypothetical protein C7S20_08010 [Christiangramia fulva]